ncbi:MAG: Fe-S cluster assembly sulfur transfer protein SufU [Kiritimatiellales bacterium]
MNITDDLYQQTILEYNRSPRNFHVMENATHFARGLNPLCGDDYTVYLRVNEAGIIEEVSFNGHGCAVSKASASLMTQELRGKTLDDARQLFHDFHELATGTEHSLGKLNVFSGVWKYPERVKCAVLAWHAMDNALSGRQTASTE